MTILIREFDTAPAADLYELIGRHDPTNRTVFFTRLNVERTGSVDRTIFREGTPFTPKPTWRVCLNVDRWEAEWWDVCPTLYKPAPVSVANLLGLGWREVGELEATTFMRGD